MVGSGDVVVVVEEGAQKWLRVLMQAARIDGQCVSGL